MTEGKDYTLVYIRISRGREVAGTTENKGGSSSPAAMPISAVWQPITSGNTNISGLADYRLHSSSEARNLKGTNLRVFRVSLSVCSAVTPWLLLAAVDRRERNRMRR